MLKNIFVLFIAFGVIKSDISIDELKIYSFKASHYFYFDSDMDDDYIGSLESGIIGKNPDWLITEKLQDSIYFYNRQDSLLRFELHFGSNESNREIFEENFELARLRAEELGVNIQLLKGF